MLGRGPVETLPENEERDRIWKIEDKRKLLLRYRPGESIHFHYNGRISIPDLHTILPGTIQIAEGEITSFIYGESTDKVVDVNFQARLYVNIPMLLLNDEYGMDLDCRLDYLERSKDEVWHAVIAIDMLRGEKMHRVPINFQPIHLTRNM